MTQNNNLTVELINISVGEFTFLSLMKAQKRKEKQNVVGSSGITGVLKDNKTRQEIHIKQDQQEKHYDRIRREAINNLSDKAVVEIARMAGISVRNASGRLRSNARELLHDGLREVKYLFLQLGLIQVSDITFLAGLTQLQKLFLSYTHITDLSPLAGLTQL